MPATITTPTVRPGHPRTGRRPLLILPLAAIILGAIAGPAAAADPIRTVARPIVTAGAVPQPPEDTSRPAPRVRSVFDTMLDVEPPPPPPGAIATPAALNLFQAGGFRYQDPNYYACTATSALVMLNLIAMNRTGGAGFRWVPRWGNAAIDSILAWERTHDTLAGGYGSDPHGWRNALNYYGWGSGALGQASRIYEDLYYSSYSRAIKTAIRQLIRFRKPVGIVAWRGRHAQMITGYDGLKGDPFARNSAGSYTNEFTISAVYLSDPLKADGFVNARIGYETLASTTNTRLRFAPYYETDSPYDDVYTTGWVRARDEWYGRWVIVAPIR